MKDKRYRAVLVVITTTLALALSPLPAFSAPQNTPVYLPSCGADPGANTRSWHRVYSGLPVDSRRTSPARLGGWRSASPP